MSASVLTALRPRADRNLRMGVVVGAVVTVAALVGAGLAASQSGGSSPATQHGNASARSALVSWEGAVHPLVVSAGQVVALGPRTGVAAVAHPTLPMAQLHHMASGWATRLSALQQQVAGVRAPGFLHDADSLLDQAMAGYVTAANDLLTATTARGWRRTALLNDASAAGKSADHLYDLATAAIAAWRVRLGLPADWSG